MIHPITLCPTRALVHVHPWLLCAQSLARAWSRFNPLARSVRSRTPLVHHPGYSHVFASRSPVEVYPWLQHARSLTTQLAIHLVASHPTWPLVRVSLVAAVHPIVHPSTSRTRLDHPHSLACKRNHPRPC